MTSERRIIVSLGDIKLVCYECKQCRAKVSCSPDSSLDAAESCFQCRAEWQKKSDPQTDTRSMPALINIGRQPPVLRLMRAISDMRNPDIAGKLGFRILPKF